MRLYVGNLPYNATEQDVRQHFEQVGTVSEVKLLSDRESGRPRGFGFVGMDDSGAQRAINELNGQSLGGRALVVNQAKERERSSGGSRGNYEREEKRSRNRDW